MEKSLMFLSKVRLEILSLVYYSVQMSFDLLEK